MNIPVFAVASADDVTVNPAATLRFMQRARHQCSKLVWYATERTEKQNVEWVNSAVPEKRILSSAHTAVVIPPEDDHYGESGGYENCLHYLPYDPNGYATCRKREREVWLGEVHVQNLKRGVLRRLMYNPHYAAMELSMQKFIEGLP
jgi:hypothetical protein